ncbi:MAG: thioesterase [Desulfobacterota bacterium]|nr:thioesterase [Thermodesulfobacteriota bacterium]
MKRTDWEESYHIRTFEVDFRNRLHLTVLFHLLQETATKQIERQGVGVEVLKSRDEAWVLSRLLLEIDRYPGAGEEIRVRTWPRGIERLFAHRDFQVAASAGDMIGKATSYWLLVDLKTRRPKRPADVFKHMPTAPDRMAVAVKPDKLPSLEKAEPVGTVQAGYSHLDLNRHVNNAVYVEWILDAFPAEVHERFQVTRLQINFQAETRIGDRLVLFKEALSETGPPAFGVEGLKDGGKILAFQARLEWGERPAGS